jgi:protease-4
MLLLSAAVVAAGPSWAQGQAIDRDYLYDQTSGLAPPGALLAGEVDARAVVTNPGALGLLGPELVLQGTFAAKDAATRAGQGVGGYWVPWSTVGLALESLRPHRQRLVGDPGASWRATAAVSYRLGRSVGVGVSWHRYWGSAAVAGTHSFDAGFSWRPGNHLGVGVVARDLLTPRVAGIPEQRSYEAEVSLRPLGTHHLELGLGVRVAERWQTLDGQARLRARLGRGVYLLGAVDSRALRMLDTSAAGVVERSGRELVATAGFEVSLGHASVSMLASGARDERGDQAAAGGTLVARWSRMPGERLTGTRDHLEKLELGGALSSRQLAAIVVRLRAMGRDPSVKAVVVSFDSLSAGWADLQELRGELLRLRERGRKVFAYLVAASTREYFVASAADKIYLDPAGGIRLLGMAGTVLYFRSFFDWVGVSPQFEKIAEYKSAPESFTETRPSEPAAAMREELYDSLWREFVSAVAASRRLPEAELEQLIDHGPYTAGDLVQDHRIVDAVATPEKVGELIDEELRASYPVLATQVARSDRWRLPRVVVIHAEGDIVDGLSRTIPVLGRPVAGAETISRALVAARLDPEVKAIVLRIDSPGGSALASEIMSREVFRTRGVKPILCSLGDMAASGGYFLAAGCDVIFAEPMTITGSIGIFYGKFDLSGLLAHLGISAVTSRRGARADMESLYRPFSPEEREVLAEKLRYLYGRFVDAVAEGRGISRAAVEAVARGRVWTGAQAKERGLVDQLGGLAATIDEAKARAGLGEGDRVVVMHWPVARRGLLQWVVSQLPGAAAEGATLDLLPAVRQALDAIAPSLLLAPAAAQARALFDLGEL